MSLGSGSTNRMTRRRTLAAGAAAGGLLAGPVTATTGATGGSGQTDEPTERWTRAVTDPTTLTAAAGRYYLTAGESLQAIDATSGRTVWTAGADGRVPEDGAAVAPNADTFLVGTASGTVAGFAATDGTRRWRRAVGGEPVGLAVGDGVAYLASTTGLTALDPAGGEPVFTADPTDDDLQGVAAVTVEAETAVVVHGQNAIVGLDANGTETWRVQPEPAGFSAEVFLRTRNGVATTGTSVYFQGQDGVNGVIDAASGTLVWRRVDDETALGDRAGGVATFDGAAVTSGENASVLTMPGEVRPVPDRTGCVGQCDRHERGVVRRRRRERRSDAPLVRG